MSLTTYLGRSAAEGRTAVPRDGRRRTAGQADGTAVPGHLATRSSRRSGRTRCSASSCSTRRSRSRGGAEALRASLIALQSAAEKAVHDGLPRPVHLRQGGVQARHRPDPVAARARGGPHSTSASRACATGARLIVQAGDIQEGHDVCCLVAFGADAVHPYLMLRLVKDGLTFKDPETKQEIRLDAREAPGEPVRGPRGHDQEDHLQDGDHDHRGLSRGACCSRRSGSGRS